MDKPFRCFLQFTDHQFASGDGRGSYGQVLIAREKCATEIRIREIENGVNDMKNKTNLIKSHVIHNRKVNTQANLEDFHYWLLRVKPLARNEFWEGVWKMT